MIFEQKKLGTGTNISILIASVMLSLFPHQDSGLSFPGDALRLGGCRIFWGACPPLQRYPGCEGGSGLGFHQDFLVGRVKIFIFFYFFGAGRQHNCSVHTSVLIGSHTQTMGSYLSSQK